MKKFVLALSLLGIVVLFSSCYSSTLTERYPTVSVTGTATVEVAPDTVSMDIRISRTAEETRDAQLEVNRAVAALVDILKAHSVEADDIITTRYEFSPEYEYVDNQRKLVGQRVSQSLVFSLSGVDEYPLLFPSLLDEIGSVSNITLSSMRYTREDISSFRSRVKELAMQDAISKGNVYAQSAGLELGTALTITDYSSEPVMREADFAMAKSAMVMADAPTQISAGDISVTASVNVVFAMK